METKKKFLFMLISLTIILATAGIVNVIKNNCENNKLLFGATYMTMNNEYFEIINDNIQEIIEGNGDVLIARNPAQSQIKQNQQIYDMIREGIDVLFLNPVDWQGVSPALEACAEHGIPVFVVDTGVERDDLVVSTIASNNYSAGVQCALDMKRKRKNADIIILEHTGLLSIRQRVEGFLNTIKNDPNYKIVERCITSPELEVSMEATKKILNKEYDFNVVFGANDPTALGAIAAMQARNRADKVLVYGVDGSIDAKVMIKDGLMEGSSAQSPIKIGRIAAETAYNYLQGKEVPKDIVVPVQLITSSDLSKLSFYDWQ